VTLPPVYGDLAPLLPLAVLLVGAAVTLLLGVFAGRSVPLGALAVATVAVALGITAARFLGLADGAAMAPTLGGSFLGDGLSGALSIVVLLGAGGAMLGADAHVRRMRLDHPEFFPLLLLATAGALVLVSAGDLIVLLLGLEVLSLAVYVLSAWREGSRAGEEAGLKYFLLGAFGSAILAYGIALTYGATGRFDLSGIAAAGAAPGFESGGLLLLGAGFLLVGLAFKVGFVPFHQWLPDVYTGAPTPVTAFMSVVVKTAAFGALLRVTHAASEALGAGAFGETFTLLLAVVVGATLLVGNTAALLQSGLKRLLAYSAIAHAGYVGLAVLAGGPDGMRAAATYLLLYTVTNLLALGVLSAVMGDDDTGDRLERLAGLGRRRPWLAAGLALSLLSLAGFPPLAGFLGKVVVFQAAVAAGFVELAAIGIASAIVAVVYYGRVVLTLYLNEPDHGAWPHHRTAGSTAALGLAALGVVLLGLFPGWWLDLLARAPMLFGGS
jgi:NADH-quinone oxidoreductase subunit N